MSAQKLPRGEERAPVAGQLAMPTVTRQSGPDVASTDVRRELMGSGVRTDVRKLMEQGLTSRRLLRSGLIFAHPVAQCHSVHSYNRTKSIKKESLWGQD